MICDNEDIVSNTNINTISNTDINSSDHHIDNNHIHYDGNIYINIEDFYNLYYKCKRRETNEEEEKCLLEYTNTLLASNMQYHFYDFEDYMNKSSIISDCRNNNITKFDFMNKFIDNHTF